MAKKARRNRRPGRKANAVRVHDAVGNKVATTVATRRPPSDRDEFIAYMVAHRDMDKKDAEVLYREAPMRLNLFLERERRREVTSRDDLPSTPLAAIYGRGVLSKYQYEAGLYYQAVLAIWKRGNGMSEASAQGIYQRMIAGDGGVRGSGWLGIDVDRPTTADRARIEIERIEERLSPQLRVIARSVVNGDWSAAIVAMVTRRVTYRADAAGNLNPHDPSLLRATEWRPHDRWLRGAADAFAAIAGVPPRLKAASLAA